MALMSNLGSTLGDFAGKAARGVSDGASGIVKVGKHISNQHIESASSFWTKNGAKVLGGATIGAGVGAGSAAVTGNSIIKGGLMGAAGGATAGGAISHGGGMDAIKGQFTKGSSASKVSRTAKSVNEGTINATKRTMNAAAKNNARKTGRTVL
jgi:hypothetical protein